MVRRAKGVKPETVYRIRTLTKEGKSANEIQRQMQKEHLSIRRTRLLGYVREFKNQPLKSESWKYTPEKYRETSRYYKDYRRYGFGTESNEKQIAVVGSKNGLGKRIHMHGSGHELQEAMMKVAKHPPKTKYLTISARKLNRNPIKYLDYGSEWDERPNIKSP